MEKLNFTDNSIIICPSEVKHYLLENSDFNNSFKHIKFISKRELVDGLCFTFDYRAVVYLYRKYGYSFMAADELLRNSLFINNEGNSSKTKEIYYLVKELSDKKLLSFNSLFPLLFKNKTVYVLGYSNKDSEIKTLLNRISVEPIYINYSDTTYNHSIYKYDLVENEITGLFIKIGELLTSGVDINHIYIYQTGEEYMAKIKEQAMLHNLPFESKESDVLFNSPLYKKFINILDADGKNLEDAFNETFNEITTDTFNVKNKIRRICQDCNVVYDELTKSELKNLLIYIGKNTCIDSIKYQNALRTCNYNNLLTDEDYVFIVGFTLDNFPKIHKDNDYLSDEEKSGYGINTSITENDIDKDNIKNFIKSTKNTYISVAGKNGRKEIYSSLLIKDLELSEEKSIPSNVRYSKLVAYLECAKAKDLKSDFSFSSCYEKAFTNDEIGYKKYDSEYKSGVNITDVNKWKNTLSYSSLTSYVECPFKFYLSHIIGLDKFEENFAANLGTFMHQVFEDYVKALPNKKELYFSEYQEFFDSLFITPKDRFFAKAAWKRLPDIIAMLDMFDERSNYNHYQTEKELFSKPLVDGKNWKLHGFVDKACFTSDMSKCLIVDYKTGHTSFDTKYLEDGLGLQLPIYIKLIEDNYPGINVNGVYINNVLYANDENKKNLELNGVTRELPEKDYLEIDNGYLDSNNSSFINHFTRTKAGTFDRWFKLSNDEDFKSYNDALMKNAIASFTSINEGKFEKKEIHKGEDNISCKYCTFKDICFNKHKNIVKLVSKDEDMEEEE